MNTAQEATSGSEQNTLQIGASPSRGTTLDADFMGLNGGNEISRSIPAKNSVDCAHSLPGGEISYPIDSHCTVNHKARFGSDFVEHGGGFENQAPRGVRLNPA